MAKCVLRCHSAIFRSVQLQENNSRSAGLAASLEKRSNSATFSPGTHGTPSVNTRASTAAAVGPDRGRSNLHTTKRQGLTPLIIGTNVTRVTPKFSEIPPIMPSDSDYAFRP